VQSVGLTSTLPMDGSGWSDPIISEDQASADSKLTAVRPFKFIAPGFFSTLGRPLITGRDFTWTDLYEKRPVLIVSENLARELWREPGAALGKRIRYIKGPWREVVGVVADGRDNGPSEKAPTTVYWPILMAEFPNNETFASRSVSYAIRSSRIGSDGFLNEVSSAVWAVNPNIPLANVRTLQEIYNKSLARTSFALVILAIAAAMALLLGLAGIYGVISYSVSQRTKEIGIRMALGARNHEVTRMFLGQGLQLAAVGVACGLAAALVTTRLMSSLLFNISAADPVTYGVIAMSLLAATLLASYVPALRAPAVDPVETLRAE
jgi:predicted permease